MIVKQSIARETLRALPLIAVTAAPAYAFLDPPVPEPNPAIEGQTVTIRVREGGCDGLTDTPDATNITIVGSNVRIVIDGIHSDDPIFCFFPVAESRYPIGTFAPGEYIVTAVHRYPDFFGQPTEVEFGTAPFTVQQAPPPRPIPTLGGLSMLMLGAGVMLVALYKLSVRVP